MSKGTLLLADDSITIQKVVNLTFADEGIDVVAVGDGDTAAARLADVKPDIVLADVNMPGLTGFQLLKSMPDPPAVIFTTAYREHALEGFDANAIDYLIKPIAIERFLLAINKALKFLRHNTAEPVIENVVTPGTIHNDYFFVKADGGLVKIFFERILFIEALKEYVKIVTTENTVITYHSISGLQE